MGLNNIIAEGFDDSAFSIPGLPVRQVIDEMFPDIPVIIRRICGHTAIINQKAELLFIGNEGFKESIYDNKTGIIKEGLILHLDKVIFPGIQGGPLMHVIAAKGICFDEALKPEFKKYIEKVKINADQMVFQFKQKGVKVITEGTDNHLLLIDTKESYGLTGKEAEDLLGEVNITVNKNTIPGDTEKPTVTSGLRLGTAAITTRGFEEKDIIKVVELIDKTLRKKDNTKAIKKEIKRLTKRFKTFKW